MNQTKLENQATLCVSSESLTATEIAHRLNLVASRTAEPKGENRDWRFFLDAGLDEEQGIEIHIGHVCSLLESRREVVAALPSDTAITIWCTVNSPSEFAGISLDAKLLSRVASIPADLIFSVYAGSA